MQTECHQTLTSQDVAVATLFAGRNQNWRRSWLRVDFCSECGSRLTQRKVRSGDQVLLVYACSKCGLRTSGSNHSLKVEEKTFEHSPKQYVSVISRETQLSTLPTIQAACPNCQNNLAYAWQVQTRGADESSTQFLRCTRCGYTFRETT